MAWIVICGIDRSGKSSVAEYYKKKGYHVEHMSAPNKKYYQPGYAGPSYLDEMVELLMKFDGQDVVFDRSWMGEIAVWPKIYGRVPLLSEDDYEVIKEFEDQNQTLRILMIDPNVEAHWKRCVANKEPLNRAQFNAAHALYSKMAHKYNFVVKTLPEFLKEVGEDGSVKADNPAVPSSAAPVPADSSVPVREDKKVEAAAAVGPHGTREQERLAYANAINAVLSKSILKSKGWPYDELEKELRGHLNAKLGDLLGVQRTDVLSREDVQIVKEFVKRLKEKQK